MIRISPSILSADFSRLEQEVADVEASGAHMLHIDVMDGHFVPNISFGSCVISSLRPRTKLFFDVHLMISDPRTYALSFAKAGADMITFHYESQANAQQTVDVIRSLGLKVGMAVKPATDISVLEPFLPQLDMALVMTVEPGFGGQKFMPQMMGKVEYLRNWAKKIMHLFGFRWTAELMPSQRGPRQRRAQIYWWPDQRYLAPRIGRKPSRPFCTGPCLHNKTV